MFIVIHFMEGIVIEIYLWFLVDTFPPWFACRNLAVNDNNLPVNHQINRFYETKIMAIFIQNGGNTVLNTSVELQMFPSKLLFQKATFLRIYYLKSWKRPYNSKSATYQLKIFKYFLSYYI